MKPDITYTLEGSTGRVVTMMNVFAMLDETIAPGEPLNFVVSVTEKN